MPHHSPADPLSASQLVKQIPENVLGNTTFDYNTTEKGEVTAVNFRLPLERGSTKLSPWFVNGRDDGHITGAYYAYVTKL